MPMDTLIRIIPSFNQQTIPASQTARLVYLLLEIQARDLAPAAPLPLNIGLVVDKSESMCIPMLTPEQFQEFARDASVGETIIDGIPVWQFTGLSRTAPANAPRTIDYVKQALGNALEHLSADDEFSLTAFARNARLLIPRQSGRNKQTLLQAISDLESVELGNETYMGLGLSQSLEQVQQGFTYNRINRIIALTDGFTFDEPFCRQLAGQAAQAGIGISTIGLGSEFNEELLISIADSSGGMAYFIRQPSELSPVLAHELSGIQDIVLRGLELRLRFMPGVQLRRIHRVRPVISDLSTLSAPDASLDLSLGDLPRNGNLAMLFEIVAPPRATGQYQFAHAVLDYTHPQTGSTRQRIRQDIVIEYAETEAPFNPQVMNIVEKLSAFNLQTRALQAVQNGDMASATQKLQAAITRLVNMGENELAQAVRREAANLEQRGQMSPDGPKQLRYEMRNLTQRL
ncbi:MAG: VWA domain-containing protein [Anaerolineae bacterium]